jgi:hypothetical protein
MRRAIICLMELTILALLVSPPAAAQWVMVARAASKRIRQARQSNSSGSGFELATVLLEAPATKVYDTALHELQQHPELKLTVTDAVNHQIDFTNGSQSATLIANSLGPKASELVVATTTSSDAKSSNWQVVNGVMKICTQMNVECTIEK